MNIENYFKKPFKLILIILGAIIFSLLFIYFSAFLIMFVLADFDMNKYHAGECASSGGAWLYEWEKCTHDHEEVKTYCQELSLVEFEQFNCGARLGEDYQKINPTTL